MNIQNEIRTQILEGRSAVDFLLSNQISIISDIAKEMCNALSKGKTIYWCGNGGSAAEAQHMAAELMGKFNFQRPGLRSIALTTDTSFITGYSNDLSYEEIFSRQIQTLGNPGDMVIVFSTSGNSENILRALSAAKELGMISVTLLGANGGKAKDLGDFELVVGSVKTPRIQEVHQLVCHILCSLVEGSIFSED